MNFPSPMADVRIVTGRLLTIASIAILSPASIVLGQTAAPELPEPKEEVAHQDVAWSPDGRWIAYSEYASGEEYSPERWSIYVVAADGSERRRLVENALYVTWSPDGEKLAFGSSRDGNREIYTINADGSDIRRLTHDDAKDNLPAWSPTADKIAFCSTRSGNEDIYVMSSDGSNVQRLTDDPASDFNPAWSPDGKYLVFFRETGDHKDQIYVVNADGSGERRITHDERLNVFPSFLPDGRIAFACRETDGASKLIRVDFSGENRTEMSTLPVGFARWSPDGKRIAFVSGHWPRTAVYVMRADGTSIRKLVN